jgi:hypothetical protein
MRATRKTTCSVDPSATQAAIGSAGPQTTARKSAFAVPYVRKRYMTCVTAPGDFARHNESSGTKLPRAILITLRYYSNRYRIDNSLLGLFAQI